MAALTTAQEYDIVREAIQTLTATGQQTVSFTLGPMSKTYNASQMPQLIAREAELARRLGQRNIRKRTLGDFT
jgi:hypothetical protein